MILKKYRVVLGEKSDKIGIFLYWCTKFYNSSIFVYAIFAAAQSGAENSKVAACQETGNFRACRGMGMLRYWMVGLICWASVAVSGVCQISQESGPGQKTELPKPPASGIRDVTGLFSKNPDALARITAMLRKLETEHGFRIYLHIEPVLIAGNPTEYAAQLQQAWLPEGDGLVVVFESDNRQLGIGRDIGRSPEEKSSVTRVPTHETEALLLKATSATEAGVSTDVHVEKLMENIIGELNGYFERRAAPPPAGRSLRLGLLIVGALTLLALIAIVVGSLVRLPSMAGVRTYRFPLVDRPERLGAPCGGGNVTVRKFSNNA